MRRPRQELIPAAGPGARDEGLEPLCRVKQASIGAHSLGQVVAHHACLINASLVAQQNTCMECGNRAVPPNFDTVSKHQFPSLHGLYIVFIGSKSE